MLFLVPSLFHTPYFFWPVMSFGVFFMSRDAARWCPIGLCHEGTAGVPRDQDWRFCWAACECEGLQKLTGILQKKGPMSFSDRIANNIRHSDYKDVGCPWLNDVYSLQQLGVMDGDGFGDAFGAGAQQHASKDARPATSPASHDMDQDHRSSPVYEHLVDPCGSLWGGGIPTSMLPSGELT